LVKLKKLFKKLADPKAGLNYTFRHPNAVIQEGILEYLQELVPVGGENTKHECRFNAFFRYLSVSPSAKNWIKLALRWICRRKCPTASKYTFIKQEKL
jgi:hypothetical protein